MSDMMPERPWEIGEKVVCIDDSEDDWGQLKKGNIYTVREYTPSGMCVRFEETDRWGYWNTRFRTYKGVDTVGSDD